MNSSLAPKAQWAELARLLAALAIGVFAGGMLTEGCVLVPWWRSLDPAQFLSWYALNGQHLHAFFSPLTSVAALLAVVAAGLSLRENSHTRWLTLLSAGFALAAVATFFIYFAEANKSFAQATLSVEQVAPELERWARWHGWRTGLVCTSALLSQVSLASRLTRIA